jgi:arylformamidase
MLISFEINDRAFAVDLGKPLDVSIPLNFGGAQPNAFDVEMATAKAFETESLVGDTRRGGSCNFEQVKFIPHCNGTHTECVGHITNARISVHKCLKDSLVLATLISVAPEKASETGDTYSVNLEETDRLITRKAIATALEKQKAKSENLESEALIIRTLPNDEGKLTKTYLREMPPFFSTEAMNTIADLGIKHLLVDLPSIDRLYDGGKLSNHRSFWNVAPEKFELNEKSSINNTITELIFVPDSVGDGDYLLNLQIAAFAADASPSRPRLYKIFPD